MRPATRYSRWVWPIARIIQNYGPNGYIASDGTIMPVSDKFSSRVVLISGDYDLAGFRPAEAAGVEAAASSGSASGSSGSAISRAETGVRGQPL